MKVEHKTSHRAVVALNFPFVVTKINQGVLLVLVETRRFLFGAIHDSGVHNLAAIHDIT